MSHVNRGSYIDDIDNSRVLHHDADYLIWWYKVLKFKTSFSGTISDSKYICHLIWQECNVVHIMSYCIFSSHSHQDNYSIVQISTIFRIRKIKRVRIRTGGCAIFYGSALMMFMVPANQHWESEERERYVTQQSPLVFCMVKREPRALLSTRVSFS